MAETREEFEDRRHDERLRQELLLNDGIIEIRIAERFEAPTIRHIRNQQPKPYGKQHRNAQRRGLRP